MIRLEASLSRKLPLPGVEYSSQSFSAGISAEVSDADSPEVIKSKLHDLYAVLDEAVNEQLAAAAQTSASPTVNGGAATFERRLAPPPAQQPTPAPVVRSGYATAKPGNGNGNGNGRKMTMATEAQRRAIFAICKNLNIDMAAVLADFNVADASQLTVKDASRLIDDLKSRQASPQQ